MTNVQRGWRGGHSHHRCTTAWLHDGCLNARSKPICDHEEHLAGGRSRQALCRPPTRQRDRTPAPEQQLTVDASARDRQQLVLRHIKVIASSRSHDVEHCTKFSGGAYQKDGSAEQTCQHTVAASLLTSYTKHDPAAASMRIPAVPAGNRRPLSSGPTSRSHPLAQRLSRTSPRSSRTPPAITRPGRPRLAWWQTKGSFCTCATRMWLFVNVRHMVDVSLSAVSAIPCN